MCYDCNEMGHYRKGPVGEDIGGGGLLDDIDNMDVDELPGITGIMFCQIGTAVDGMEEQSQNHRSVFTEDGCDANQLANARRLASNATASTPQHFAYCDAILSQAKSGINRNWSLLYSQSTCDLFVNTMYLLNIRERSHTIVQVETVSLCTDPRSKRLRGACVSTT